MLSFLQHHHRKGAGQSPGRDGATCRHPGRHRDGGIRCRAHQRGRHREGHHRCRFSGHRQGGCEKWLRCSCKARSRARHAGIRRSKPCPPRHASSSTSASPVTPCCARKQVIAAYSVPTARCRARPSSNTVPAAAVPIDPRYAARASSISYGSGSASTSIR